jgi:hypothetical protein
MSAELELLDQLVAHDMPLGVLVPLFPDVGNARRAIIAMIRSGDLELLDVSGSALPDWRLRELEAETDAWGPQSPFRLHLTDAGARRIA